MVPSGVTQLSHPCIYEESRFMKRLGKLFRSGPSRGEAAERSNPNPQLIGDENVLWRALPRSLDDSSRAQKEKEELDHAIALALAEDLKKTSGYRWQTEKDDELARSLQEGLNPPLGHLQPMAGQRARFSPLALQDSPRY